MVVPVHNDASKLIRLLGCLRKYPELEILIVDCASEDELESIIVDERLVHSPTLGRGFQIATGIDCCVRPWIWILHADAKVDEHVVASLATELDKCEWGRFDVRLESDKWIYRLIGWMMNNRSALTGICTGDQGIFVKRHLLALAGGIPEQALMEDIELSVRLRRFSRPHRMRTRLLSSVRKWETNGVIRTISQMWWLRVLYFIGYDPDELYQRYYR